jgi:thiol-disulfide isomerase/thioredoxin
MKHRTSLDQSLVSPLTGPRRRLAAVAAVLALSASAVVSPHQAVAATAAIPPRADWPFVTAPAPEKAAAKTEAGGIGTVLEVRGPVVVVKELVPGGPAAKAGLQPGDIFVEADGWQVPPGAQVADVAGHVRGAPGQVCQLKVLRGNQTLSIAVTRVALSRLFPEPSKTLLALTDGSALLAPAAKHTVGVKFSGPLLPGQMARYRWLLAADGQPLAAGQQGDGVVQIDLVAGASIQVAEWKLDLKVTPEGTVFAAASNLPVHPVVGDWLQTPVPLPSLVKPKSAPAKKSQRWEGPAALKLVALDGGKPLAGWRVAVKLAAESGQTQDSKTVYTDAKGQFEVPVPPGKYRIVGLAPASGGKGRDASLSYTAAATEALLATDTPATPLALATKAKPSNVKPVDWSQDGRVGQGLPALPVLRWYGAETPPKSLKGKVLLLDFWATWCGPCRATAPLVAELHSRLAAKGLLTVAVSVDRDEEALTNWAADMLPGAPPVAWMGPEAMELLEFESIPTFIVLDGEGRVRGFHKGGGWDVDAVEAWLTALLDEQRPAGKKR